jgi:peptidoglycan/LPS O-acetylase OafA/YrhL
VRAVTTPIAAFSLILLLPFLYRSWRRRDPAALSLLLGLAGALAANAAMAGALSDVHDRYQSRIVWLAFFAVLALTLRWRSLSAAPAPRS